MIASDYKPYFQNWKSISEENLRARNADDKLKKEYTKSNLTKQTSMNAINLLNNEFEGATIEEKVNEQNNIYESKKFKREAVFKNFKLEFGEYLNNAKFAIGINLDNAEENSKGYKELGAKKIICSDNNTTVLGYDGNLYCFGSYLFKLSSDKVDQLFFPIQPRGIKVIHMGVGANHILLVSNN